MSLVSVQRFSIFTFVLLLFFVATPIITYAAVIDINTANVSTLKTLPGIGSSKATAIIQYRTQNGLFTHIADIQNVSGIGPSTFANIKPFITIGSASKSTNTAHSNSTVASTSPSSGSAVPSISEMMRPPLDTSFSVSVQGKTTGLVEVPITFSAVAKTGGNAVPARYMWSFGDGSMNTGNPVRKIYHYKGTYLVSVISNDISAQAEDEFTIVIGKALVQITAITGDGVTLSNNSNTEVDISNWKLTSGSSWFRFPRGTHLLAKASVLFPMSITNLPVSFNTTLTYPDTIIASRYLSKLTMQQTNASTTQVKLNVVNGSNKEVKVTEKRITKNISKLAHENSTVIAPRESAKALDSRGAVFTTPQLPDFSLKGNQLSADAINAVLPSNPGLNLLKSKWTLGFFGIIALAGGAFMIL